MNLQDYIFKPVKTKAKLKAKKLKKGATLQNVKDNRGTGKHN